MADVVYFDSGINLPFCPPTINGLYISGSGCCSDFYTAFIGGNQTYNLTYTLPTSSGTSGQVLTNDGNGNLSWQTFGGGVGYPGGIDGMMQYNNGGSFGGTTLLYWDDLNNRLGFNTTSPQQSVDVRGTLRITGSVPVTPTNILGRDGSGDVTNISIGSGLSFSSGTLSVTGSTGGGSGTITGTGTTNYLSKWSSASGLTDSIIIQTGSNVDIRGTLRVTGSTGTGTTLMARNANFDVSAITVGTGLSLSGNTISVTGSTGGGSGTITGTGTTNYLSKWSSASGLTDSIIIQTGSNVDIRGTLRVTGSTGTATSIMGRDGNFDVSSISIGSGLSLSGNTISVTGSTGGGSGTITGTGTTNYLSKWSSASGLTDSIIIQTGSNVDIRGTLRVTGSTGTATSIMGRDGNFDVSSISIGSGLSLSGNTISVTGSTGGGSGTITGTGTTNYLSKWSSASGLTDSIIIQTGSNVDIRGTLRVTGSTGTATSIMGRDGNFDVSAITVGTGLSLSGNTISVTGSTGGVTGNYVPYIGATGNTDLGGYGIAGSYFQLSTSTGGTLVPGMFSWNGTDGTADLMLKGGSVTLQIGQEQLVRVINETGANLLESEYKVVRVIGATANRLKVGLALASGETTSAETIGIVTENISLNQEGFVTTSGLIRNINTTGSLQGETWADGDMLYLSPSTFGAITNIKPQAPNHIVILGYVVRAGNNGSVYVKVDNGYELNELHNVAISGQTNNDLLAYDSSLNLWKNRSAAFLSLTTGSGTANYLPKWSSASGFTDSIIFDNGSGVGVGTNTINTSALLQLNSTVRGFLPPRVTTTQKNNISTPAAGLVVYDSTLNNLNVYNGTAWTSTLSGSGVATRVAFWDGTTSLSSSSNFTWDNTNSLLTGLYGLTIGNSSVINSAFINVNSGLDSFVKGMAIKATGNSTLQVNLFANGTSSILPAIVLNDNETGATGSNTSFFGRGGVALPSTGVTYLGNVISGNSNANSNHFGFIVSSVALGRFEAQRIFSSGNIIMRNGGTYTDTGYKLDINALNSSTGGLRVSGIGTTTAPTLLLQNSGSTQLFRVTDDGAVKVGTGTNNTSAILQIDSTSRGFLPPRMSTTNKTSISNPTQGLVVYDTTMQALSVYNGTNWATAGGGEQMFTVSATTATVNFNSGNIADITLASSTTLTLTGGTFGTFILKLTQDAVGGRTVSWPSTVKWSGGIPPTLTTSPSKSDIISFIFDGSLYYGTYALNF